MHEVLHVNGSTTLERHGVTSAVDAVLQSCGAAVTDYHQFSNVSMSVSFEIQAGRLGELARGLQEIGVWITSSSIGEMERVATDCPERPIDGTVQVTFFHKEADPHVYVHSASHGTRI